MINYLKYSGASVTITINPYHWRYFPWLYKDITDWNDETYCFSFLFLTFRIWIDNGDW